jgi:enoyl-CoA hydratase/carnithine racemase
MVLSKSREGGKILANKAVLEKKFVKEDGIVVLTLNRPEKRNALSKELLQRLLEALEEIRENDGIRCVVTTGSGNSYSSGLDLYDLRDSWTRKRKWYEESTVQKIINTLRLMPQVTLAAVNGYCLGGGLALLNGHDLAVTARSAKFGMPEIIRGSFGQTATSTLFHAGIPVKKAFYIQITGKNLTAEQAERIGLVSEVVPDEELMETALSLAKEIATRNPVALEHAKIAAYMERDVEFSKALRIDELVSHRMRAYTDPLADVGGYLKSQKGGGSFSYRKGEGKKSRS